MKVLILAVLVIMSVFVSLLFGSATVAPADLVAVVNGQADPGIRTILLDIRLPRSLLAVLVGSGVAVSGAAIQGLFRNPLADPALIGVSAGAALFAALFLVVGVNLPFLELGLAGSAFIGGLLATWLVLWVGQRAGGISIMLLAGVAVNAIALSGVGLLSYLSSETELRSISFWALGSLNGASWRSVAVAGVIPLTVILMCRDARPLNLITLGDEEAHYLGVTAAGLRQRIVFLAAIAVGVGVALTGVIAFLGLIVPHLVRLSLSSKHELLLPASALLGGLLLLLADNLARTAIAPAELPVGILTALIGGPFFIYLILLERSKRLVL